MNPLPVWRRRPTLSWSRPSATSTRARSTPTCGPHRAWTRSAGPSSCRVPAASRPERGNDRRVHAASYGRERWWYDAKVKVLSKYVEHHVKESRTRWSRRRMLRPTTWPSWATGWPPARLNCSFERRDNGHGPAGMATPSSPAGSCWQGLCRRCFPRHIQPRLRTGSMEVVMRPIRSASDSIGWSRWPHWHPAAFEEVLVPDADRLRLPTHRGAALQ